MSQTAARAFELLEIVVRAPQPVGLVEIAAQANLDKSTASRLLAFLEEQGFVRRDHGTRKFQAGPHLWALASMAMQRSDVRRVADPELNSLAVASSETVSLHVRVGDERVCVGGVESQHDVRRVLPLGEPIALYAGPSAKAILAFLSSAEQDRILRTISGRKARGVRRQLMEIRGAGYIATVDDRTAGTAAVSAPLFDPTGVFGSITISGPAERWTPARMKAIAPALVDAAHRVSWALGVPYADTAIAGNA